MRIIMVPVADRPEAARALDAAFFMAEFLDANVVGIHIRPHRYSPVSVPAEMGLMLSASAGPMPTVDADKVNLASQEARDLLTRIAEKRGFEGATKLTAASVRKAVWQEDVGSVEKLMPIIGPLADLIVVSRPKSRTSAVARLFMSEALLHSSRPVLLIPPSRAVKPGRHILIGWDRSHEAMRAVVAAMPLLQRADSVIIVECGPTYHTGPSAAQLRRYLRVWGVKAATEKTRGRHVEKELLDTYREHDCDLLVMGSYSRSRLRERIFGGMTDFVVNNSTVSVFTIHG